MSSPNNNNLKFERKESVSPRTAYNNSSKRVTSPVRGGSIRTTSPIRGSSYRVSSPERTAYPVGGISPVRGASYRVSSPERTTSPRRSISPIRNTSPVRNISPRTSYTSPLRSTATKRVSSPIIRRSKYTQGRSTNKEKSYEEKNFEAGINIGSHNMGQNQETKLSNISAFLPSVISQLSLGMESDFKGELTTILKGNFRYVLNLPKNRIATGSNRQIKIWYTPTDELLLTIDASPVTKGELRMEREKAAREEMEAKRREEGEEEEEEAEGGEEEEDEEEKNRKREEEREKWLREMEEEEEEVKTMKFFEDKPVICGNNIVVRERLISPETSDWVNTLVVYDSENGDILYSFEDTKEKIGNLFSLSDDTIFFSLRDPKYETVSCYVWNLADNQSVEVISDPYTSWGKYIKVILLPDNNFALFHKQYLSFYNLSNLEAPYMLVSLNMGTNMDILDSAQIIYLSNGEIVCTDSMYMFWINSKTGKITRSLDISNTLTTFPLGNDKAVTENYEDKPPTLEIRDLKTTRILSRLPNLSSHPIKYMLYFAVGLLPNGNLVSVYERNYLVVTNLSTNQHEYVIDLEGKISEEEVFILEDGGIAVNYHNTLEVWR
jgi:hypothetical protein